VSSSDQACYSCVRCWHSSSDLLSLLGQLNPIAAYKTVFLTTYTALTLASVSSRASRIASFRRFGAFVSLSVFG